MMKANNPPVVIQSKPIQFDNPPLLQGDSCVAVIFGATGDLTSRKLIPSLFNMACIGCTSNQFMVLGVGRNELSQETFREQIRKSLKESNDVRFSDDDWQRFAPRLHYMAGDVDDRSTYDKLRAKLEQLDAQADTGSNHLFYFATPPSLAPKIVDGLDAAGLTDEEKGWTRVVIEKPFGHDLASAQALNEKLAHVFNEDQIYRIDHYLGKNTVQNILVFRFGNSLFEPVWNRNYVDYVEITAAESIGVGSRAGYYEQAGALRDMVASHLLQLLALTAMEPPVAFDAHSVREEKEQVWRSMQPLTFDEIAKRTVRGQYGPGAIDGEAVPGYRDEHGVSGDSVTETFVALEFRIENWRWAGVPFYVRTGKRLGQPLTEIAVHLKRTPHALFARTPKEQINPNVISLRINPDEGVTITFGAKRPGSEMHTANVQMDFCYETAFNFPPPSPYETLLLDVMRGDATLFPRADGVEAQWKVITPIVQAWAEQRAPSFPNYPAGSSGPAMADELLARNGHRWRTFNETLNRCNEQSDSGRRKS
jgi:glucose-6-phosphate 1-dehydrogenase